MNKTQKRNSVADRFFKLLGFEFMRQKEDFFPLPTSFKLRISLRFLYARKLSGNVPPLVVSGDKLNRFV